MKMLCEVCYKEYPTSHRWIEILNQREGFVFVCSSECTKKYYNKHKGEIINTYQVTE